MVGYNYKKLLRKGGLIITNFNDCYVKPFTSDYVKEISSWSYGSIYDEYSFLNHNNGYLLDEIAGSNNFVEFWIMRKLVI